MKTFKFKPYQGMSHTERYMKRLKYTDQMNEFVSIVKHIGVMAGTVDALYDLGSPMAWQYNKALHKVRNIYGV